MWSVMDIAWLAGLIEGEGCISLRMNDRGYARPTVAVSMTDLDVLERAHRVSGLGTIKPRKWNNKPAHWKDAWIWSISGRDDLYALLVAIYRFMGKRRGARIMEIVRWYRTTKPFKTKVHGMRYCYMKGCRCEFCRAAASTYTRQYMWKTSDRGKKFPANKKYRAEREAILREPNQKQ
jgi:hypothetical protein